MSEGVLFYLADNAEMADKRVNVLRFADKDTLAMHRAQLRRLEKGIAQMITGAVTSFANAGVFHASAEEIYGRYVDFSKVDGMRDRLIREIFKNNM
jgi:hypothetical protein